MKHLFCLIPIVFILLLSFTACEKKHHVTNPDETGNMPIMMSLAPAFQHGFNVTRVNVRITKGDYTNDMDMVIDSTTAGGTFEDLEIGTYAIDVTVYDSTRVIAAGQGTGTVEPGQTTTVHITLQFVPGGLEVVVNWGLPYEDCRRILFVGNSHTYYNGGVNAHLQSLINVAHPEWGAVVQARTAGGYTLENHYNDLTTMSTISSGNWDLVILQEQSSRPMNDPELFYHYCTALDSVITHSGALTGFYMTWAWRHNQEMYEPIRDAYTYIGAYLDALVGPCGVGYHNAWVADSTFNMYNADNYHPNMMGTYMAACTFLATIWNVNPIGNTYHPDEIDSATAEYLQTLAWTTVQNYRASQRSNVQNKFSNTLDKPYWQEKEQLFQLAM